MNGPVIKVLVLPGGNLPVQGKTGDIGWDFSVRAIVDEILDPATGARKTLWDLTGPPSKDMRHFGWHEKSRWSYVLHPTRSVKVGVGVVFGGDSLDWYAEMAPRGNAGLKRFDVIHNHMDRIPIDPNFRGEPIALLTNNGDTPLKVEHGWKVGQLKFFCKCCQGGGFLTPTFQLVNTYQELGQTTRGIKCHGSSGIQSDLQLQLIS